MYESEVSLFVYCYNIYRAAWDDEKSTSNIYTSFYALERLNLRRNEDFTI